jgi:DNA polymerase family A
MLQLLRRLFPKGVWFVDTEYGTDKNFRPIPELLIAREHFSRKEIVVWKGEFGPEPPYPIGPDSLIVVYFGSAELGVHEVLNWKQPARLFDDYVEYKLLYNCRPTIVEQKLYMAGTEKPGRNSLGGAMIQFGLDPTPVSEKKEMRELAQRGGPFTPEEKIALEPYCRGDVDGLEQLFLAMLPQIDLPRALLRGQYMCAVAIMEANGIPFDKPTYERICSRWGDIKIELVARVDAKFGVYEGTEFRARKFERYLAEHAIVEWPRYPSGSLILTDKVFRDMCRIHPELNLLRELRHTLTQLRPDGFQVGEDGRCRCLLSPFSTKTSRHAASGARFIFNPSTWKRALIKPSPGSAVAYIDFCNQEFAIAGAKSGDEAMISAYNSGDPYLAFAKLAGAVPEWATKETHPRERELYKQLCLAISYGMEERSLALRLSCHVLVARSLLQQHHDIFWRFWQWSDNFVNRAMLTNMVWTVFGWRYHITPDVNIRSVRNFPMQADAQEVLRLAVCFGIQNKIKICCPVHDAVLIESRIDELDSDIERMRECMTRASKIVLNGFELRTEFTAFRYPDRFMDETRGREFWELVMSLL